MPPSTYTNVYKHFKLDASSANVGMPNQLGFKINLDKNKQENLDWTVAIKNMKYDVKNLNKFTFIGFTGYSLIKWMA